MRIALDALLFLAAFALPFVLARRRERRWGLPVTMAVAEPDPREAARCLAEIAARLDAMPERMRIDVSAPDGMALDLAPDGRLVVRAPNRRPHSFDLRGRWIADHDLPLALNGATLFVEPVDANRFRVATSPDVLVPPSDFARLWLPVASSLAAAASLAWLVPEPLAAIVGYASASTVRRFVPAGAFGRIAAWIRRRF